MKQTTAYTHFWETTREVLHAYTSPITAFEIENKAKSLLDINPEGTLLKEIKTILDDLHVILDIKEIQQRIFKKFRNELEFILVPDLKDNQNRELQRGRRKATEGLLRRRNSEVGSGDDYMNAYLDLSRSSEAGNESDDATWTLYMALSFAISLKDRIADLANHRDNGERIESAVSLPLLTECLRY